MSDDSEAQSAGGKLSTGFLKRCPLCGTRTVEWKARRVEEGPEEARFICERGHYYKADGTLVEPLPEGVPAEYGGFIPW
jgi:hypothetical protein